MRTALRSLLAAAVLAAAMLTSAPRAAAQDDFGGGVAMGADLPDLRGLFVAPPVPPCPLSAQRSADWPPNLVHEASTGFFLERRRSLGLDATQRTALAELRIEAWRTWRDHAAKVTDAEARVWSLSAAGDAPPSEIARAIGRADAARTAQRTDATRTLEQAVAILTPAQRQRVLDRAR